MNKYTVFYGDIWNSGSHHYTRFLYKHIEANSVQEAFNMFDRAAIYVFEGHINPLTVNR